MPLQATSGAASYDAFGGGVAAVPNYIEDVFSTYLWTTSTSNQTIANGIDMTKGAMTWIKSRSNVYDHVLQRAAGYGGDGKPQYSNSTSAGYDGYYRLSDTTSGFTMGTDYYTGTPQTAVVWTFRKQPKFFDVVTYTGDGTNGRAISHNLGSTPGFIVVKCTSDAAQWVCWHRAYNGGNGYGYLNDTTAWFNTGEDVWGNGTSYIAPTSTTFTVKASSLSNLSSRTYVAYLFAHNAGGFGLTGTDNVISCGTYTTNGSGVATVDLGYEPQWVLTKATSGTFGTTDWVIADNMRGMPAPPQTDGVGGLFPNLSNAEDNNFNRSVHPTSTGFVANQYNSTPYIYIAIRRGPMKVPTSGTSVFAPSTGVEPSSSPLFTAGFSDMTLHKGRIQSTYSPLITDRLRGKSIALYTSNTNADSNLDPYFQYDSNAGAFIPAGGYFNNAGGGSDPYALYAFRRAPSFFDEVCYTGTGSATTFSHNLGVAPELVIVKWRSGATGEDWAVMCTAASSSPDRRFLYLDLNAAGGGLNGIFADSSGTPVLPSATQVYIGTNSVVNKSAATYVAYLFATCAGVSKVGSYTGNGSTQTINCGFTGGARFVLIKRTDSTGDWYTYDTARGMTTLTDPYLLLNSAAAESATLGSVTTVSTGFALNAGILAAINTNGASYIFLAIA